MIQDSQEWPGWSSSWRMIEPPPSSSKQRPKGWLRYPRSGRWGSARSTARRSAGKPSTLLLMVSPRSNHRWSRRGRYKGGDSAYQGRRQTQMPSCIDSPPSSSCAVSAGLCLCRQVTQVGTHVICEETKVGRIGQGVLIHKVEGICDDHLVSPLSVP